jgi:hypothetical protein
LKYRADGTSPDDVKFLRYFRANQKRRKYVMTDEAVAAAPTAAPSVTTPVPAAVPSGSRLEAWILAPLIFVFLGFDNGQMRRYFIGLVPNRYF